MRNGQGFASARFHRHSPLRWPRPGSTFGIFSTETLTGMASLCILSDTHRKHREITIPDCDILIHCGDFCSFQRADLQTLKDVDAWFSESPAKHVLCVGGNHDFLL